jgi:RNA polymerase sigma-70 factor (ECF subfamily)
MLYNQYAPALYLMIVKLSPDKIIASTLLEKSFVKIWQSIEYYDISRLRLFTWMVQITLRECKAVWYLPKDEILNKLRLKPLPVLVAIEQDETVTPLFCI